MSLWNFSGFCAQRPPVRSHPAQCRSSKAHGWGGTKLGWRGTEFIQRASVHRLDSKTRRSLQRAQQRDRPNALDTGAVGTGLRGVPSSGGPFPPPGTCSPR